MAPASKVHVDRDIRLKSRFSGSFGAFDGIVKKNWQLLLAEMVDNRKNQGSVRVCMGRFSLFSEVKDMGKRPSSEESSFHEFVPLLFARNLAEAEFYKLLLEDHDVPVLIEDENTESIGLPDMARGVPVLVADEYLSEAEAILKQRAALEDDDEDDEDDDDDEDDAL